MCWQQVFKMAAYGLLKATGNRRVPSDDFLRVANRTHVGATFLTPYQVTNLIVN